MSVSNRRLSVKSIRDTLRESEAVETLIEPSNSTVTNKKGPGFGVRHQQMLLLFLLIFISYSMRINLSVAIVAMTDPDASSNPNIPTFNWTDKSVVLSAFYWGYILPQIAAGWLGNVIGPKWFLIGTMITGSFCGIFTPLLATTFGSRGVMVARAILGVSQGFVYPSVHGLLSKWVPLSERSRFGTFVYAAAPLGSVVAMTLSGFLASSWYGWPTIFYLFGSTGLGWCVIYIIFGYNTPSDHEKISREEKEYIQLSTGFSPDRKKRIHTPWCKIFMSLRLWAILLTQCGYNWCFLTLITETPVFMNKIMKFDIKSNSLLSSLPYFIFWLLSFPVSYASDWIINKRFLSVGATRKVFNTLGFFIPTVALIYLGNCDTSNTTVVVVLLIFSISGSVSLQCGYMVNHLDISPNHAGTLMGITNGISNTFGIFAPLAVQFIVTDETDPTQWKMIFFITASINIVASAVFICFGSGEVQEWNDYKSEPEPKEDLILARKLSSVI